MSAREATRRPDEAGANGPGPAPDGQMPEEVSPDSSAPDSSEPDTAPGSVSRRPWIAGALGATWALLVGLALLSCMVMAIWALSPTKAGDSGAAWRAVGMTWLGTHQTALSISGLPVSVLPLGAVLFPVLLLGRGGRWSARLVPDPSLGEVVGLLGGATLVYGAGGAGVAWLSSTPGTGATLRDAFLACGAVAAFGTMWGLAREADLVARLRQWVSPSRWRMLRAGCAAALGLFVLGAAMVALSLVVHVGAVFAALTAFEGGVLALAGITLVNVLTLPTLAIWAAAFAAGPGFSLGQLGSLSPFGGEVAALPALPVLVAIPSSAPGWGPLMLIGPVACGFVAGRVHWRGDVPSWPGALVASVGVGAVVAPFVAVAVLLTRGSVGGGALAEIGPAPVPVTLAAVGLVVLGFLGDAAWQWLRLTWELHQALQRPPAADAGVKPEPAAEGTTGAIAVSDEAVGDDGQADQGQADEPSRFRASALVNAGSAARSRIVWAASATLGQAQTIAAVVGQPTPTPEDHLTDGPDGEVDLAREGTAADEPRAADEHDTVALPWPAAQAETPLPSAPAEPAAEPGSEDGAPPP